MKFNGRSNFLLITIFPFIMACNNENHTSIANARTTPAKNEKHHEHTYRCPMHPEVTGKENDACPKCGMKLQRLDEPVNSVVNYYMQVEIDQKTVEPGKDVTLSFTPKIKGKENEPVALDIEHEKKIHLILVSDDLSWFDHIHPEYSADGRYNVRVKFPVAGRYQAFADYKPVGKGHVIDKIDIHVVGNPPAPVSFDTERLEGNSGDYSFRLTPPSGKFATGSDINISGIVMKDGKEIDAQTLDNFLGAKAHVVVIGLDEKNYQHVHPSITNGKFNLHTRLETPGLYRCWVQFNAEGEIHTIDFTFQATEHKNKDEQHASKPNSHSDLRHTH